MFRKQLILIIAVLTVFFSAPAALAEKPCTQEFLAGNLITLSEQLNMETQTSKIPNEYKDCSDILKEAASRGLVPVEGIKDSEAAVTKQDAVRLIYDILIKTDGEFALTDVQAEEILSTCFDNALLRDKNRIAYASMIRHGVVGTAELSEPDKILSESDVETLMKRVDTLFRKKQPVTINGNVISIGSSVNELFAKMGEPSRIDKSEYDFDWYVYNSDYMSFIMFGVRNDVVCAYYSNSANFEYGKLKSGTTDRAVNEDPNLRLIRDSKGRLNAIYYNSAEPFYMADSNVQSTIFADLINAHRAKSGLVTFITKDVRTVPTVDRDTADKVTVSVTASGDCFEAYDALVRKDKGDGILSRTFPMASEVYPRLVLDDQWEILAINSRSTVVTLPSAKKIEKSEIIESGEEIKQVRTPKLVSPKTGSFVKGGSLKLKLKERTADRYLVKIYNCETEKYDVNAYINCKTNKITIPAYALTHGNVYRACVTAVAGDKEFTGNTVEFTYGEPKTPLTVLSPKDGAATYDDELEIKVYSSAYKNFRVEVFDQSKKPVLTRVYKGTDKFVLPSLPAGVYTVNVTAVSNADGKDKASETVSAQIKQFTPIIREFILEQGEKFDYYYGDGEKWLYFYDAETVAVKENKTITVFVPDDMAGDPDPAEKDSTADSDEKEKEEEKPKDVVLDGEEVEDDVPETALEVSFVRHSGIQEQPTEAESDEEDEEFADGEPVEDESEESVPVKKDGEEETEVTEEEAEPDTSEEEATETEDSEKEESEEEEDSEDKESKDEEDTDKDKKKTKRQKPEKKQISVTVYKTKITQRIVPATKRYKALAVLIPQRTQTTGAFIERTVKATPTETGNAIASLALSYQGVPYVWGGTSPTGFDCSGLVKYVCNSLGIKNVARTSAEQFKNSGVFVERDSLIPGDLVFFQKDGVIHHVGIYIGNDMFVHAPHTGDVVKVSSLKEPYFEKEYAGAKRVA